jgi:hypothetical protein
MNYLTEINAFYRWSEINTPSKSEIALWHAYMHLNNTSDWQVVFTVPLSTLASKAGLSISDTKRYRNKLVQKGRILWKERKGNQSSLTAIIPFDEVEREKRKDIIKEFVALYEPQVAPQTAPQVAPQTAPQVAPQNGVSSISNKLNINETLKDDIDNKNNTHARDPDDELREYSSNILLSSNQVYALTDKFRDMYGKNSATKMNHYICRLSRMKMDERYVPPDSDYDEILKLVEVDKQKDLQPG